MKSIILDIFYGNKNLDEFKVSNEYKEAADKAFGIMTKFNAQLNQEQTGFFNSFCDAMLEKYTMLADDYFTEGFKIGLLVGIEAGKD